MKEATAWLAVSGKRQRVPIGLRATGVAPDVCFSQPALAFGKVTVGACARLELELLNYSDIQVEFQLNRVEDGQQPKNIQGTVSEPPLVEFSQTRGTFGQAAAIRLGVSVTPRTLGRSRQTAYFDVLGRAVPLTLEITCEAIAPLVELRTDPDRVEADASAAEVVDFGTVSFGFSQQREIHLKNAGDVGQSFDLRVEPICARSGRFGAAVCS